MAEQRITSETTHQKARFAGKAAFNIDEQAQKNQEGVICIQPNMEMPAGQGNFLSRHYRRIEMTVEIR
ncbi:hypothetical protein [uncultured Desulfosarcina sp.]|uniref:hypothetical protein n=1 Tax=uncultured Desulfosarcina sp. TaxID=218289 RepID=UPI0029C8DA6D|nr:hypothetical protein [uncultured Desulfosarcina sp.]